jgi:UDP:flavonoid glycosyltransferase YjiC (YdhE family)
MVPLARAFLDRGDQVSWAGNEEACARLADNGFQARPAGLSQVESMNEFLRRFPEYDGLAPSERPDFMFPRLFGAVRAGPMLADLLPIARSFRPTVVIHEQGELAAPITAALLGVPHVTHGFGSLVPASRVAGAGDFTAPLWKEHGLEARPFGGCYEHLYLDIFPPSLADDDDAGHVPAIQPIRPVAFATAGEERLPEWVGADGSTPLVYVTFGTVFNNDLSLISTIVRAARELPVGVVVTLGPAGDSAALGEQPDNVHVARYIPQTELLPHCAVVVSHAGSGTFLAAMAQGLPQLCVPQAADQFRNAASCAGAGAGLALQPGTTSEDVVADAIKRLLFEPGFRDAAGLLAKEIEAMPGPDEVAGLIAARWAER